MRPLAMLLAGFLVVAYDIAPACAVDCAMSRSTVSHSRSLSCHTFKGHHGSSIPIDDGKGSPEKEHPCGGGSHYPAATRTLSATDSAAPIGPMAVVFDWLGVRSLVTTVLGASAGSVLESPVLPVSENTLVPLRI